MSQPRFHYKDYLQPEDYQDFERKREAYRLIPEDVKQAKTKELKSLLDRGIRSQEDLGLAMELVRAGANPNVKADMQIYDREIIKNVRSFLHMNCGAYYCGSYRLDIKSLIELVLVYGADVNSINFAGQAPLELFSFGDISGEVERPLVLLSLGANPDTRNPEEDSLGHTFLHKLIIALSNITDRLSFLDETTKSAEKDKWDKLLLAIQYTVKEMKADINIETTSGHTALGLYASTENFSKDVFLLLLNLGADHLSRSSRKKLYNITDTKLLLALELLENSKLSVVLDLHAVDLLGRTTELARYLRPDVYDAKTGFSAERLKQDKQFLRMPIFVSRGYSRIEGKVAQWLEEGFTFSDSIEDVKDVLPDEDLNCWVATDETVRIAKHFRLIDAFSICWMQGKRLGLEQLNTLLYAGVDPDLNYCKELNSTTMFSLFSKKERVLSPLSLVVQDRCYDYALAFLRRGAWYVIYDPVSKRGMTVLDKLVSDIKLRELSDDPDVELQDEALQKSFLKYLPLVLDCGVPLQAEREKGLSVIAHWLCTGNPEEVTDNIVQLLKKDKKQLLDIIKRMPEKQLLVSLDKVEKRESALGKLFSATKDREDRQLYGELLALCKESKERQNQRGLRA